MTIHIGAKKNDVAKTVLMPGDPMRAKWAADKFLNDVKQVNAVRGMLGFTGKWKKIKLPSKVQEWECPLFQFMLMSSYKPIR